MAEITQSDKARRDGERGYILLMTALGLTAVISMAALAIDLGRMYVAKNEAQSYVDAAALRAALELDGSQAGFQRARDAVAASTNRWNFGHASFSDTEVEFSQNSTGPWEANPIAANDYRFVNVTGGADIPMTFARVIGQGETRPVGAGAVAGQVLKTGHREGGCPFSPIAHNAVPPNYGLTPGNVYTLRWAPSPRLSTPNTLCAGDATQEMIDLAEAGGGSERGYIEETSAAVIRKAIIYDYQSEYREIGDTVSMTGGAMQSVRDALRERVNQDSDSVSQTFAAYDNLGQGNGRRLFVCPINSGAAGGYTIVQYASFFLLPASDYQQSGSLPFCAEYVGSYVQGSDDEGGGDDPGYYVVRLAQ